MGYRLGWWMLAYGKRRGDGILETKSSEIWTPTPTPPHPNSSHELPRKREQLVAPPRVPSSCHFSWSGTARVPLLQASTAMTEVAYPFEFHSIMALVFLLSVSSVDIEVLVLVHGHMVPPHPNTSVFLKGLALLYLV